MRASCCWARPPTAPTSSTARAHAPQAGFYGLDLYSLHASIRAVVDYLDQHDPEAAARARERYA